MYHKIANLSAVLIHFLNFYINFDQLRSNFAERKDRYLYDGFLKALK